jgi:hypothetical protein
MTALLASLFLLATGPFVQLIAHHYGPRQGLPDAPVTRVWVHEGSVFVQSGAFYRLSGQTWAEVAALPSGVDAGRKPAELTFPRRAYHRQAPVDPDARARVVAVDGAGHHWIGTDQGIVVTTGDDYLFSIPSGPGGLPHNDVTAIALDDAHGGVWVGFSEGAALLDRGRWRTFWGRRWLPDNHVHDIAVDGRGGAWIATDGGVAHIEARTVTLEEKARHYEAINAARHNRYGFTAECIFEDLEDGSRCRHEASDNDGLWTSLTVAAEAFRYAVTGDEEALRLARQSMKAMLDLVYRSGAEGFPARAIARVGEENVHLSDAEQEGRWLPSPSDGWLYKTDTSSDEIAGHYLAWYLYSEHVADAGEKAEIAEVCRAVTDRILNDGLLLLRPDGRRTTWGVWSPEDINDDPTWWQERALNSMEILSHLRVALHLTGEARYAEVYESLIREHHYLLNAAEARVVEPPSAINHSDDELWFVVYYPIALLEQDPAKRRLIHLSIERTWQWIRPERSPLYNFMVAAMTGRPADLDAARETLERWPWDLRRWTYRNSHRADLPIDPARSRPGRLVTTIALPPDERSAARWNENPYVMDGGNGGRTEPDAAAFLLPYWLGRYHGLLP